MSLVQIDTISLQENNGPYFTLKGKLIHKDSNGIPGPGVYDINTMFVKARKSNIGMGLGGRYSYITHNPKIPGPGTYNLENGRSRSQLTHHLLDMNDPPFL